MKDIDNIYTITENNDKKPKKNINKKRMIIAISIGIILVIVAVTALLYYSSRDVRSFLDQYLFRKNIFTPASTCRKSPFFLIFLKFLSEIKVIFKS